MRIPKLTKIEKVILIGSGIMVLFVLGFWLMLKRQNRVYLLDPTSKDGWVVITYSVPGAPPLEEEDGKLLLRIPNSKTLETSTPLNTGWGRDEYFWSGPEGREKIPSIVEREDDIYLHLHHRSYRQLSHTDILHTFPVGTDTTLWDGTRIQIESQGRVEYTVGRKTLEIFYISKEAQPLSFVPTDDPPVNMLESTEDREITSDTLKR